MTLTSSFRWLHGRSFLALIPLALVVAAPVGGCKKADDSAKKDDDDDKGGKKKNERPIDEAFVVAALQAWLPLVERKSEFVCATAAQIYAAKERFTTLTGIEFNENGLRNSFATYARAYCGSGARVSELMGNSLSVARKHYITALPAGRGQAYFGLRPLAVVEKVA